MCLLLDPLRDFFELELPLLLRRFLSFFAFSCAINSRISAPVSTTTCAWRRVGDASRERGPSGVATGVQSCSASSKTAGKRSSRSSSEINEETISLWSSSLEVEESEALRGHEGYAQEGDCGHELEVDGMSIGDVA
jgi:hypothetical protein